MVQTRDGSNPPGAMFRRISAELDRQHAARTACRQSGVLPIVVGRRPDWWDLAIDLGCAFGGFLVFGLLLVAVFWEWM